MSTLASRADRQRLQLLERALVQQADELALFLVYDRPDRERERLCLSCAGVRTYLPALGKT